MSKWEKKFGRYAIHNLTVILIMCYVAGYVIYWFMPAAAEYLRLNPYAILHGQIWRLVTWVISPPSGLNIFTVITLLFYYTLGTMLEREWGVWQYNVYIFTGMLLTVAGAFLSMGIYYLLLPGMDGQSANIIFSFGSIYFSTYYVNMSIYLAYALTFPESQILLMMVIPVKVKWLGILEAVMLVFDLVEAIRGGVWFWVAAISASLLNVVIFYLKSRTNLHPKVIRRRAEFRQDIRRNPKITKHKCAVCGQTDGDDPALEFRFCSKCNGNYEYCRYHLFTHEHVK